MRIRLKFDVPIAKDHGMVEGRELDVVRTQEVASRSGSPRWFVIGDTGTEVGILPHEAEIIER